MMKNIATKLEKSGKSQKKKKAEEEEKRLEEGIKKLFDVLQFSLKQWN